MTFHKSDGYGPSNNEPIAIVGIGCRFPGNANSPDEFWHNLVQRVDSVREVPGSRWDVSSFLIPTQMPRGKPIRNGLDSLMESTCLMRNSSAFLLARRPSMDPQQRMVLEVAYEAIEDGGQTLEKLSSGRTCVFVGISSSDFSNLASFSR